MADPVIDPLVPGGQTAPTALPTGPVIDVQEQINQALASQQAEFSAQLKEATGHGDLKSLTEAQLKAQGNLQELLDHKTTESSTYKGLYEQTQISNALLAASTDALDAATISQLLSGKAVCDDKGVVTIDGKSAAEAVKALLAEKPFLAKPQGDTGSGVPQHTEQNPKPIDDGLTPLQRLTVARSN